MLYYCAVKGEDMGFGELHKHLIKYVQCPAKRYWCVFMVHRAHSSKFRGLCTAQQCAENL